MTGGAGFIGSHLVRQLCGIGAKVTVLDLRIPRFDGLDCKNYELVEGDVADRELVDWLVKCNDYVFHLATQLPCNSLRLPFLDMETTIEGILNILLAAKETDLYRIIFTSSGAVYGNARHLPTPEDEPPDLLNPYAITKYAAENYCRLFYDKHDVPSTIARLSNVYGPGASDTGENKGVVTKFIQQSLNGGPMTICGDGEQARDFVYIDDVVDGLIECALQPRALGETINLSTAVQTSVNNLAWMVASMTLQESKMEHLSIRDTDDIRNSAMSPEKARRILKWSAKMQIVDGLKRAIEAYAIN